MLRKDIVEGFHAVLSALEQAKILELLQSIMEEGDRKKERDDNDERINAINAFRKYVQASQKFNEASRTLVDVLNLDFLDTDDFWHAIMSASRIRFPQKAYLQLTLFIKEMPKIIKLLEREVDEYKNQELEKKPGYEVLTVLMVEDRGHSAPTRVATLMDSIQLLYEACAELSDVSSKDLCLISCDSGSDKSFDFLGVAKLVEQVRKVLLDVWDRVIFYRERKLGSHLDLLSNSLPIIEKISELEKNKKLGPEHAEKLRRKVVEGVGKFIRAGAIIPEMKEVSSFEPRQLLAPEPKLLTAPTEPQPDDKKTKNEDSPPEHEIMNQDPKFRQYVERVAREIFEKERSPEARTDDAPKETEGTPPTDKEAQKTDAPDQQ